MGSPINFSEAEYKGAIYQAQVDFYDFSRWMFLQRRGYPWIKGVHHKIICDALMQVFNGECKRLIINIPPRYSKTELAIVNFMAWCLGRVPDCEFIHTSYSSTLASNNAWQTRELVTHEKYREVFPNVQLRHDSAAKHEWRTTAGGCVYATGAGGTITGYGAGKHREGFSGAILIDDPHKADEARSDVIREGVIDWFQNTLESRKNSPQTPIILIMQRLHERDLAGWLIDGGNGEEWELIKLPALNEQTGEALWPEKHTAEELKRIRNSAPYTFAGQYQQEPAPPEGNTFHPDKMEVVEAIPLGTRFTRGWDLASTANDGDWTVGAKIGQTPDGRWIVADIVRLQGGAHEVEAALVNTARRDGNETRISIPQDPGQAGKAQIAYLTSKLSGFAVDSSPESGDKVTRAEPFASQMNVGNVMMLKAPWNDAYVSELRLFPNGRHDDQVDASSRAFNAMNVNDFGLFDYYEREFLKKQKQTI